MAAALTPLARTKPRPATPVRWTVDEFHRMWSQGMLTGRRPYLIDGVILEQGPMDAPHANGVERADTVVRAAFGAGWRFRVQLPLVVGRYSDLMPDIAVLAGTLSGSPGHPTTAALVIEVADTTLKGDTTEKAEQYATAGIVDYWVLDVNGRRLLVFRDPVPLPAGLGATAYRNKLDLGPGDLVNPLAAPTIAIAVSDLLP